MKKVLVVDDSATMRRMIIATLGRLNGVAFDQAVSGLGAIERVTLDQTDMIILDLNMPDVHGLEVLKFIRNQQSLREIPVVILTTRGDDASRAAALEAGATVYLTKPFSPEGIVEEVQRLLQLA